jgi:D-alanyl-D-alanine carboxypeptidase
MTTRRGHRLAFCVYVNNFAQGANDDITHIAGEAMGELANAAYTDL